MMTLCTSTSLLSKDTTTKLLRNLPIGRRDIPVSKSSCSASNDLSLSKASSCEELGSRCLSGSPQRIMEWLGKKKTSLSGRFYWMLISSFRHLRLCLVDSLTHSNRDPWQIFSFRIFWENVSSVRVIDSRFGCNSKKNKCDWIIKPLFAETLQRESLIVKARFRLSVFLINPWLKSLCGDDDRHLEFRNKRTVSSTHCLQRSVLTALTRQQKHNRHLIYMLNKN